ncbi:hypothetical protein E8E14_010517 [Neopestalotiopsis sp. 37M]|nr:hypothetical protein E8E14_010517 [Neopestalotiopsis sp. 37M]
MPRKKKGAKAKAVTVEPKHPPKKPKVVEEWEDYFKQGDLSDWLRLMGDLGLRRDYSSITQCRKNVWVNIRDFLDAVKRHEKPHRFTSQHELAQYTLNTRKIYPKKNIPKGSPLRRLLANIRQPSMGENVYTREEKELDQFAALTEEMRNLRYFGGGGGIGGGGANTPGSDLESHGPCPSCMSSYTIGFTPGIIPGLTIL